MSKRLRQKPQPSPKRRLFLSLLLRQRLLLKRSLLLRQRLQRVKKSRPLRPPTRHLKIDPMRLRSSLSFSKIQESRPAA
jgi:hypothetical protein